jgi:hypothetical protein
MISNVNIRAAGVALFLALGALISVSASTLAGNALSVGPYRPGDIAHFTFRFVGKFGQPKDEIASDQIVINWRMHDAVMVTARPAKPASLAGRRDSRGTIVVAKPKTQTGDLVNDYNTIVGLTENARPGLKAGDTWNALLRVRLSPKVSTTVPVVVRVVAFGGGSIVLEAHGQKDGLLFYKGFTFPYNDQLQMRATFTSDGYFRSADFLSTEATNMGQGPTISYTWHFAAAPK